MQTFSNEPPDLPFSEVGSDLFENKSVEYYSKYIEVDLFKDTTNNTVIEALKTNFRRHGISFILQRDYGSQLMSAEFPNFFSDYVIVHKTSSPLFQS